MSGRRVPAGAHIDVLARALFDRLTDAHMTARRIQPDDLRAQRNNFTAARLFLASCVIWTHCYWLIRGVDGVDEFLPFFGVPLSHMAVNGFFFVSGFLVTGSVSRKAFRDFALARFARLWPALAVAVCIMLAVGIGASPDPAAFVADPATARFAIFNLSLLKGSYTLPSFACTEGPCMVNGSLWTIPWEVRCYAALALLYVVGPRNRLLALRVLLTISLAGSVGWFLVADRFDATSGLAYNVAIFARLWGMFTLGGIAYLLRFWLPLNFSAALIAFGVALVEVRITGLGGLVPIAFCYLLLCLIFPARRSISGGWPDYSYGVYIYAFPVMLLLQRWLEFGSHPMLALATFSATLPLAALSWHLVEKPALTWARARSDRRNALPDTQISSGSPAP